MSKDEKPKSHPWRRYPKTGTAAALAAINTLESVIEDNTHLTKDLREALEAVRAALRGGQA